MEKISHANIDQKQAGVDTLLSYKVDFRAEAVTRDEEGPFLVTEMLMD